MWVVFFLISSVVAYIYLWDSISIGDVMTPSLGINILCTYFFSVGVCYTVIKSCILFFSVCPAFCKITVTGTRKRSNHPYIVTMVNVLLLITHFRFRRITFHLVLVLFVSLLWSYMELLTLWKYQTLTSFRLHLKTYILLLVSLSCTLVPIPNATWFSSETLALYNSLTSWIVN